MQFDMKLVSTERDRTIPIIAMRCVFSGPPRAGKTTVVKRLKGQDVDITEITASTGVVDERGVVRIDFIPSSNVVTDQEWVEMEEDDEVQAFLNLTIIPQQTGSDEDLDPTNEDSETSQHSHMDKSPQTAPSPNIEAPVEAPSQSVEASPLTVEAPSQNVEASLSTVEVLSTSVKVPSQSVETPSPRVKAPITTDEAPSQRVDTPLVTVETQPKITQDGGHAGDTHHESKDMVELSPKSVLKKAQLHSQQIRAARRLCKRHFQAFLNLTIIPQQTGSDEDLDPTNEDSETPQRSHMDKSPQTTPSPNIEAPVETPSQSVEASSQSVEASPSTVEAPSTGVKAPAQSVESNDMVELSPKSVLERAQRQSQQIRAARRLCKRHFLHLSDTGGQPEFRKMIALLIPRQSITFIVSDMRNDFDSSYPVRFCHHTNDDEIEYSSFSIKGTINDIFEHIYCSELHSKIKGSIMFIGTHKDLISIEKREEIIMCRNKELLQILEQCPHYHPDMVIRSDEMNIIFCVDNSTFETEHRCIKSRVMSICESERFQVKVTPELLLLALTLKGAKGTVLPLDKCVEVAMDCGIAEEDVRESLVLLHEKLMMIRVYELNENDAIVVVKPKALINKVSSLLKYMITRDKQVYSNPVVSCTKLEDIAVDGEYMETDVLIKVLVRLLIIAPIPKPGNKAVEEYIVPSMFPDSIPAEIGTGSTVPSIFNDSTPEAVRVRAEPNQLLLSFKPFKFSVPSTLHAPVLCSLLQDKQWSIQNVSKNCIIYHKRMEATVLNVTFKVTYFTECFSLCLGQEWDKNQSSVSSGMLQQCFHAELTMISALRQSMELVGYGDHKILKYCLSCFEQVGSFADTQGDCSTSHVTTPLYPDNIWFSKVSSIMHTDLSACDILCFMISLYCYGIT